MCFSASASFTAGAVLTLIGIASIKRTRQSSELLFACIPFIFGVQQIAEGILWLTLPQGESEFTQNILTYIFLIFAQILWPIWVPVAFLMLEKNAIRKIFLKILVVAGLIVSGNLAYYLINYHVEARIVEDHIKYIQNYPLQFNFYSISFYILATIAPPFFSSFKNMWLLGTLILVSYLITFIFYNNYLVSVWCFFASIISFAVFLIIRKLTPLNVKNQSSKMKNKSSH